MGLLLFLSFTAPAWLLLFFCRASPELRERVNIVLIAVILHEVIEFVLVDEE